jgi:glutamyl-tRNA reductase
MQISVTGLSHHTSPVSVRERFAVGQEELPALLPLLKDCLGPAVVLSTCNRTEVYLASQTPPAASDVVAALAQAKSISAPEGADFFQYSGLAAARHLFRVAAGLDSLVVGETEVLGQVRTAFAASNTARAGNHLLARLFHSAIRAGRRARSETGIGEHGLSVSATAAQLCRRAIGDLRSKAVLVIGAGEAGRIAASSLVQQGAGRLLVTTRNQERARDIARDLGGAAFAFAEVPSLLAEVDIVLACTSAPEFVVAAADVRAAMRRRPRRPLVIVDIAVPRDIEPEAGSVHNVSLFDIDDLQAAAEANLESRRGEIDAVEAIVEQELSRFEAWLRGQRVMPAIATLRRRAEEARLRELEATLARLPHLSEADRQRLDAMTRAIVKRVLHTPVERLRRETGQRHLDAARELFDLNPDES